uniref:G-protein coupled receptors family 1 profile domain-containing protein n=1 Tax=Eptatretus burgeri TaxID=7764 RepID=A0A8C4N8P6_EPTBU
MTLGMINSCEEKLQNVGNGTSLGKDEFSYFSIISITICIVLFGLSLAVNGNALWVFICTSCRKKVYVFMMHLACIHLVFCTFIPVRLFLLISRYLRSRNIPDICYLVTTSESLYAFCTLWFYALTSMEQFLSVTKLQFGKKLRSTRLYHTVSIFVWLLAAAQMHIVMVAPKEKKASAWHQLLSIIFGFLLPFVVIIIFYSHIINFLLTQQARGTCSVRRTPLRIIFTINCMLTVLFLPYHIAVGCIMLLKIRNPYTPMILQSLALLMEANSVLIFPIYALISKSFRKRFRSVFRYRKYLRRSNRSSSLTE